MRCLSKFSKNFFIENLKFIRLDLGLFVIKFVKMKGELSRIFRLSKIHKIRFWLFVKKFVKLKGEFFESADLVQKLFGYSELIQFVRKTAKCKCLDTFMFFASYRHHVCIIKKGGQSSIIHTSRPLGTLYLFCMRKLFARKMMLSLHFHFY